MDFKNGPPFYTYIKKLLLATTSLNLCSFILQSQEKKNFHRPFYFLRKSPISRVFIKNKTPSFSYRNSITPFSMSLIEQNPQNNSKSLKYKLTFKTLFILKSKSKKSTQNFKTLFKSTLI